MSVRTLAELDVPKLRRTALLVAAAGVLLCLLGLFLNREQLFRSWLFAHQFVLGLALGGLGMLLIHYLMGGQWGILVERAFAAMARTLPLLALLFIPLAFGMRAVYAWADPAELAAHPALQAKAPYLNVQFFWIRAAVYFAVWIGFAWLLTGWSLRRDRAPDAALNRRLVRLSALGLVLYFLLMTFAAIDWMMSIEPEWYSSIYGAVIIIGQGLQAIALGCVALYWLGGEAALRPLLAPKALYDLGNMLMAFVVLWAYMAFVQYLIIWMGNLSEEIPWVLHRTRGGWQVVAIGLIALHFFLPFFLLLFRVIKRNVRTLMLVATLILAMRLIGMHWLIAPTYHPRLMVHWLDLAALAAIGGLWLAAFLGQLVRMPPAPLNDPRMQLVTPATTEGAHP